MFNFQLTPVVRNLLIVNLVAFFVDSFMYDLTKLFGLYYIFSDKFYPFQFLTYMLSHAKLNSGGFSHIFFNMFALIMFGPLIERFWGSTKFLVFYLVTGFGAGLVHSGVTFYEMHNLHSAIDNYAFNPTPDNFASFLNKFATKTYLMNYDFINTFAKDPTNPAFIRESIQFTSEMYKSKADIPMIGASGAVFGLLMAFGLLFPQMEMFIFPLPFPIKAWIYVTGYGLIELYSGVRSAEGDNVAHFAHLGGMIFAFIMIRLWHGRRNNEYY